MAQSFFPITPTEVTPGSSGSHQDVDVSGSIASGATGVILHIVNTGGNDRAVGLRKNGSSDDRPSLVDGLSHLWAMVGVDGDRIFECEVGSTTDIDVYLVGYTMAGVTFKTNADDISYSFPTGSFRDIDCSTEAPSATGIIIEVTLATQLRFGLRKNGSSDDRPVDHKFHGWAIIGCDGSQIIEGEIESNNVDFFLIGYVTDGATFATNADDKSLGSTGSYIDIDCSTEAPSAGMLFIEVVSSGVDLFGLRENGQSGGYYDIYQDCEYHPWAFVKCDSGQVVEGKIETTNVDFFLIGYAEGAANVTVTPTTLAHTITQYTPVFGYGYVPGTLAHATTKYIPVLKEVLTPTTKALSLSFYIPVLGFGIIPSTLSLVLTGYASVLKLGVITSLVALSLSFFAPTVTATGVALYSGMVKFREGYKVVQRRITRL